MVQQDNNGKTEVIKALGVPEILEEEVGHKSYRELAKMFPGVNPRVFDVMVDCKLDLLIGNTNLSLQPKCSTGLDCKDCLVDLCCYQRRFGHGHVLISSLKCQPGDHIKQMGIRRIALCKVFPTLEGGLFQSEALGVSPIERCTSCKSHVQSCCF